MREAPPSAVSWAVSNRPHGEVLTVEERTPALSLWLLGQPENSTPEELRGWLHDVAGVAFESAAQDAALQPIPALLRHALSGLLFSHSEMWTRNGATTPLCSVAFTNAGDELGFGWIGDAVVTVLIDGSPADVRWVLVRDDRGREARAWSIAPGRSIRVRLTWSPDPADPSGPVVVLEASTSEGPHATANPGSAVPISEAGPSDPVAVVDPPSAIEADLRSAERTATESMEAQLEERILAMQGGTQGASAGASERPAAVVEPAHVVPPPTGTTPDVSPPIAESAAEVSAPVESPARERPSSGIARWLSRNFAWLGGGGRSQSRDVAPRVVTPRPGPVMEPVVPAPSPAEQQHLPGLEEADAASTSESVAAESIADESPSREDELAATAAALAAALGGFAVDGAPAAATSHEDAGWVDAPREEAPQDDALYGDGYAAAPEHADVTPDPEHEPGLATPLAPERVFEMLPDRIPPTPEPPALTARAVRPDFVPARDPREIALPDAGNASIASAPESPAAAPPRLARVHPLPVRAIAEHSDVDVDPRTLRSLDPDLPIEAPVAQPEYQRLEIETSASTTREPFMDPLTIDDGPFAGVVEDATIEAPAVEAPAATAAAAESARATEAPVASEAAPEVEPAPEAEPPVDAGPTGEFGSAPRRMRTRHPDWPSESEVRPEAAARTRSTWIALGAVIAVLFGAGWLVGSLQLNRANAKDAHGPFGPLLAALGVRPPSYAVDVRSQPDGAWILVDGKPVQQRTPATLTVTPGHHDITLSFGEWGQAVYPVEGAKGASRRVDGTLWGSLDLASPEPGIVVSVAVDGRSRGFAPLVVDSLAPGPHPVRFSGPGLPSWGETVDIRVGEQHHMLPRTVTSPATGLLEVRATLGGAPGSGELSGARVWIDAQPRGATPLTLELPRGPHSVRVEYQGEPVPVQVIDLPGGNQRFATFVFGSGAEFPLLTVEAPAKLSPTETPLISATLRDLAASDVRELWLHVRGSDGTWNRYPMTRLEGQLHAVGAVAFPVSSLDAQGRAPWYVSAVTAQGDEYFTEIQTMEDGRKPAR